MIEGDFSLPVFDYLQHNVWVFTEKVDGTNIRIIIQPGEIITYGGKTDDAQIPTQLLARLQAIFEPQKELLAEMFPSGACLYGEGYGAKIQKVGQLYGDNQDFVLFDVKVGEWWLERPNLEDIATKLSLRIVPIIGEGTLHDMVSAVRVGIKSLWGDFQAEGIVARPKMELKTRNGERIVTKLKTKDFAKAKP